MTRTMGTPSVTQQNRDEADRWSGLYKTATDIKGALVFDSVGSGTRIQWSWELNQRISF